MEKPPCVEIGRPLNWCARALQEQQVYGKIDLPVDGWKGWRIRGERLLGPGGMSFSASMLSAFWRSLARLPAIEVTIKPTGEGQRVPNAANECQEHTVIIDRGR